jgi:hypothetical protein
VGEEPQRAQFASEQEYLDARVAYTVEKKLADRARAEAEARARAESERVVSTYAERLAAAKAEIPDFDARIEARKDLPIPPHIRDAIFESEVGPKIALHFADHPEEATRIARLTPNAALREFGKIEAMIEGAPAAARTEEKPALKVVKAEVSAAPPPIAPLKATGVGEAEAKVDAAGKFTGTYAEWKALRKAGKIR